jgi:glycosyl hydrolase family 99
MTAHGLRRMLDAHAVRRTLIRRGARAALGGCLLLAVPSALAATARPATAAAAASPAAATDGSAQAKPIPVLAYYYIWFNASSWNRAKIDYPLAGRYSSDDVAVMRQQVSQAQHAGISGFMVSWKDTPLLDRRLAKIEDVAAAAHFKLGIVFEGRDFHGKPLSMTEVERSFRYLIAHYGKNPVFHIFGKPLVAWSGTWAYTRPELAMVSHAYGAKLTLLAMEKDPAQYQSVAGLFRGDAYYWSSVDPLHTPRYAQKLGEFSAVVHRQGGLWIAPAAPGFDARLVGGTRVISRRNGQTLRLEINAAIGSGADAIGLISWNEYSENSEVEPDRTYGGTALKVIATIEHVKAPTVTNFDSNGPSGFDPGPSQFVILGALIVLFAGSAAVIVRRRGRAT